MTKKRIKSVVVSTITEGKDGIGNFPSASMFRGEQALVEALADFYELEDITALAADLAVLLVDRKVIELEQDELWNEWQKQGGHHGNKAS